MFEACAWQQSNGDEQKRVEVRHCRLRITQSFLVAQEEATRMTAEHDSLAVYRVVRERACDCRALVSCANTLTAMNKNEYQHNLLSMSV